MADSEAQNRPAGTSEQEPLLGSAGDATQPQGKPLYVNLTLGTAVLAQAGILILAALIWAAVFQHQLMPYFSPHPLLNSAALLFLTQGILILQPTHTAPQKRSGAIAHSILNALAFGAFVAAFVLIYYNKSLHNGVHFQSPHAIMGITFYSLIIIQALIGFLQFYTPAIFGGVDNAKSLYKYHRWSGYFLFVWGLATVCAATYTDYNINVLGIQTWTVGVASFIALVGILPRIRKQKMGL